MAGNMPYEGGCLNRATFADALASSSVVLSLDDVVIPAANLETLLTPSMLRWLFVLSELVGVVSGDVSLEVKVVVGMSVDRAEEVTDTSKSVVEGR